MARFQHGCATLDCSLNVADQGLASSARSASSLNNNALFNYRSSTGHFSSVAFTEEFPAFPLSSSTLPSQD